MKIIRVYELPDSGYIRMPLDAKVLTMRTSKGTPYIYAEVDDEERAMEMRSFNIVETGGVVPVTSGRYLGLFSTCEEMFEFHVYEAGTK